MSQPAAGPQLNTADTIGLVGHGCADLHTSATEVAGPGQLVEFDDQRTTLGGPIFNVGGVLTKLGATCELTGLIGNGFLCDQILKCINELEALGNLKTNLRSVAGNNSWSFVQPYPGNRGYMHNPGTNAILDLEALGDLTSLKRCPIVHYGYPALLPRMTEHDGAQTVELLRQLKEAFCTTSLDHVCFNQSAFGSTVDWYKFHQAVMPLVDIVTPSLDEMRLMFTMPEVINGKEMDLYETVYGASSLLHGFGAKIVLMKLGPGGLFLSTALLGERDCGQAIKDKKNWSCRQLYIPAFKPNVEKPLVSAAGDAAIAGFLAGLISGLEPEQCLLAASAAAGFCCEAPDAIGGIVPWEQMWQRVAAGWEQEEPIFGEEQGFRQIGYTFAHEQDGG